MKSIEKESIYREKKGLCMPGSYQGREQKSHCKEKCRFSSCDTIYSVAQEWC